jgi:hypothetical protein
MTVAEDQHDGDEYARLFLELIESEAERTRLDAEGLVEAGFVPVFVRGSPTVIWGRWDGHFTTQAALSEIRPAD